MVLEDQLMGKSCIVCRVNSINHYQQLVVQCYFDLVNHKKIPKPFRLYPTEAKYQSLSTKSSQFRFFETTFINSHYFIVNKMWKPEMYFSWVMQLKLILLWWWWIYWEAVWCYKVNFLRVTNLDWRDNQCMIFTTM